MSLFLKVLKYGNLVNDDEKTIITTQTSQKRSNFVAANHSVMLFNSIQFAIFLPIVFLLYWFVFDRFISKSNYFGLSHHPQLLETT